MEVKINPFLTVKSTFIIIGSAKCAKTDLLFIRVNTLALTSVLRIVLSMMRSKEKRYAGHVGLSIESHLEDVSKLRIASI